MRNFNTVSSISSISNYRCNALNVQIIEDEYANTQYPITSLKTVTLPDRDTDLLLCAGHFNALHVYSDGKVIYISHSIL